jgi:hypothetical protein
MQLCDRDEAGLPGHSQTPADGSDRTVRTFFYQRCPACGRALRTPIQLMGTSVDCSHCQMQFVAHIHGPSACGANRSASALERADLLLAQLAGQCRG